MGAEMGAALANDQALDRPTAPQARSARALVDREPFRVLSGLAVGTHVVAEARSPVGDPLPQDLPDGPMQTRHLVPVQRVGRAQRMQAREPESLVGIDVPHSGDEGLVEEQALQPSRSSCQPLLQAAGAERWAERFRAVPREDVAHAIWNACLPNPGSGAAGAAHPKATSLEQADPTELAHVPIAELPTVGEAEDDPRVPVVGRAGSGNDQGARHAQRDGHHAPSGEPQQDALCAPADPRDDGATQLSGKSFRRLWMADCPVPAHLDIDDLRAGDPSLQVASDGLDLGKLRHARSVAYPPALDGDGGDRL